MAAPTNPFTRPPAELLALLAACKESPQEDAPRLVLVGNQMGDTGAIELAAAPALAGLLRLELSAAGITAQGALAAMLVM
jgi:hypothetical protein